MIDIKKKYNKKNNYKKKKRKAKVTVKEKVSKVFELPAEIILDMPQLVMMGNKSLIVENYKGVIEYGVERIRLNTGCGIVSLNGLNMSILEITSEDVMITGEIKQLEFL